MDEEPTSEFGIQNRIAENLKALKNIDKGQNPRKYAELNCLIGEEYARLFDIMERDKLVAMPLPTFEFGTARNYYHKRTKEEKAACLISAVQFFEESASSYSREANAIQRAKIQIELGWVYFLLSRTKDTEKNLSLSIQANKEALAVCTKQTLPREYARAMSTLGLAYVSLSYTKDKKSNISLAFQSLKESLSVFTKQAFPIEYSYTQMRLAMAYRALAETENRGANLQNAVKAYKEAQTVFTEEKYPVEFSETLKGIMLL